MIDATTIKDFLNMQAKKLMQNLESGNMIDSDYTDSIQLCIEATLNIVNATLQQMYQEEIAEIREECFEKSQAETKGLLDRVSVLLEKSTATILTLAERVDKAPVQPAANEPDVQTESPSA